MTAPRGRAEQMKLQPMEPPYPPTVRERMDGAVPGPLRPQSDRSIKGKTRTVGQAKGKPSPLINPTELGRRSAVAVLHRKEGATRRKAVTLREFVKTILQERLPDMENLGHPQDGAPANLLRTQLMTITTVKP